MTHSIFRLLMLLFLFGCFSAGCEKIPLPEFLAGENFLLNSGVESGGSLPDEWTFSSGDSMAIRRNFWSNEGFESSRSVMLTREGYDIEHEFWGQTRIGRLQANKALVLRAKIKTVGLAGNGAALVIRGDASERPRGPGEVLATSQGLVEIGQTQDWTEFEVRLEEGVSRSIRSISAYCVLLPETTGTVYFDDIRLGYAE